MGTQVIAKRNNRFGGVIQDIDKYPFDDDPPIAGDEN